MEQSTVINSVIGEGTFYNGNIDAVDILRIDGNFVGTARSRDVILVGMNGKVKGTLSSSRIIVTGMMDGIIQNTAVVILQSSSMVLGVIEADSIIVESNAAISATLRSAHIRYVPDGALRDAAVSDPALSEQDAALVDDKPLVRIIERFSGKTLERMFTE